MAVEKELIENLLRKVFLDAEIEIVDLVGDKDHYQITIQSMEFTGKSKVVQHQMVYQALGDIVGNELHALSLITKG